jgi:hypothetical protein
MTLPDKTGYPMAGLPLEKFSHTDSHTENLSLIGTPSRNRRRESNGAVIPLPFF